ncbi:hypothetical protein M5C90_15975 [Pseudomonas chlororaphis subsp. piscium]|nr:hypothetical protein M5C90_15975 [Pseudomonas chlororaphis subsp. piscium]
MDYEVAAVGGVVLLAGCAGREPEVRALLAERRQRIAYERELVAAAGACE